MDEQPSKKKNRQNLFRIIYILGTIVVILLIGLLSNEIHEIKEVIPKINLKWIGISLISVILFWLSDSILLGQVTSYIFTRQTFRKSLKVGIMGLYYGALTPFASGGQPMQVVSMKHDGIPYGVATAIITVKFIVYELSLCLLYIVAMLVRGNFFYIHYHHAFWITTAGFLLNVIAVGFISLVIMNRKVAENVVHGVIHFLVKIRIIRKEEKRTAKIDKLIDDFHISSAYISNNIVNFLISIVISTVNLAFLFAIPYFIYRAFGLNQEPFILLFTLQAFLFLAVSLVPLPGAAGASEGGFYLFFSSMFGSIPVFMPMIIWRFFTYYLILLVGSFIVILNEVKHLYRSHREYKLKKKKTTS